MASADFKAILEAARPGSGYSSLSTKIDGCDVTLLHITLSGRGGHPTVGGKLTHDELREVIDTFTANAFDWRAPRNVELQLYRER